MTLLRKRPFLFGTCFLLVSMTLIFQWKMLDLGDIEIEPMTDPQKHVIILPSHGNHADVAFNETIDEFFQPINGSDNPLSNKIIHDEYKPYEITNFRNIPDDSCSRAIYNITVEHTEKVSLDPDLSEIVQLLVNDNSRPYSQFFRRLKQEIAEKAVNKYWYRFGGSSVFLREYGVHLMVSRVVYSPTGVRSDPLISLVYVQIYDTNWVELKDTELRIPKKGPDMTVIYESMKFPQFLDNDIYYNLKYGNVYGPEDPRILLIDNELGFQEPLIVFNMLHRVISDPDIDVETIRSLKQEKPFLYRSIFGFFPYSGTQIEFKFKDIARMKVQKNWTPFVEDLSFSSLQLHHTKVNFIYRYSSLQVLSCDLEDGNCEFIYQFDENIGADLPIDAMRGGTALMPLPHHEIIPEFPETKKIWIGFSRTHLDDCGCGTTLYRPNFFVFVQHLTDIPETADFFEILYMSGSVSLEVEVTPWNQDANVCQGTNVLIPNGISYWDISSMTSDGAGYEINDYLGLTLSSADDNVAIVHIKGLFNEIMKLPDILDESAGKGNSVNVACAVESARDFCDAYGMEMDPLTHILKDMFGPKKGNQVESNTKGNGRARITSGGRRRRPGIPGDGMGKGG